jgi:hypothetical protein
MFSPLVFPAADDQQTTAATAKCFCFLQVDQKQQSSEAHGKLRPHMLQRNNRSFFLGFILERRRLSVNHLGALPDPLVLGQRPVADDVLAPDGLELPECRLGWQRRKRGPTAEVPGRSRTHLP